MRALIQRISNGSVSVDGSIIAGEIQTGLIVFLGIGQEDNQEKAKFLARKIGNMRIFPDDQEKMNLSVLDVKGEIIVVSQFTLYADTRKGNRPSFTNAASPLIAEPLVDYFCDQLGKLGINTQQGKFGAHMQVALVNDGPVTIWMEI
ncbi:MAG: D-tyrosyl-tRNA(Tyr) deacylase [Chloroflexi bacterium HGW-Chloroflexi-10]|nr:MAG: D-tyrosyl-tRNA(Tyr) deacylase [Chloroflexi bacterium HGW-Chloroflexi-10]